MAVVLCSWGTGRRHEHQQQVGDSGLGAIEQVRHRLDAVSGKVQAFGGWGRDCAAYVAKMFRQ
jgi:hypothetical protein